jgi:hypothetical protein
MSAGAAAQAADRPDDATRPAWLRQPYGKATRNTITRENVRPSTWIA